MISILSPAKTLDFDSKLPDWQWSQPDFVDQSEQLVRKLRSLSKKKISSMMNLSKGLTELNVLRYHEWSREFTPLNSRPALLTFSGDVYRGLNASELSQDDLDYAQEHLRILSGLHGVLRPLDLIQPYRLEMGTCLPVQRKKNLYEFWQERVTRALNEAMEEADTDTLINLASAEYSKVVDLSRIKGRVINVVFKDFKNGEYKAVMTWAKLARGAMAGFIIRERISDAEALKGFREYGFNDRLSTGDEWVFTREPSGAG